MPRPALVGPVTGRDQAVFCSESCRQRYALASSELIEAGWTTAEVNDVYAHDPFGHAYWKPACSTCGKSLVRTIGGGETGGR